MGEFLIQHFSLRNIFWYFLIYGLVTLTMMRFIPPKKRKKILTYTIQGSFIERILALTSILSRNAIIIVSFFISFYINVYFVIIGNLLYISGLILTSIAMWQFSREEMDKPITWGLYQVSRNPMQVMGFVLSLGVAIIANNLVLWILTIVNIVTSYPMFFMQEKYCIERYGEVYMRYMQRTPRVLFINKRMKKS